MSGVTPRQAFTSKALKNKISQLKTPAKKTEFLINCIKSHGKISSDSPEVERTAPTPAAPATTADVCENCDGEIYYDSHSRICKKCGFTRESNKGTTYRSTDTSNSTGTGSFISPGTLIAKIKLENGNTIMRDLGRVNTWLSFDKKEQPFIDSTKRINEVLDILEGKYNTNMYEKSRQNTIAMWNNVFLLVPNTRGSVRRSLQSLCVYYSFKHNGLDINLTKLAIMFDVKTGDIYKNNSTMKTTFDNTEYAKFINLISEEECDVEISDDIKNKITRVKSDIGNQLSDPLTPKQYSAIIYYIAHYGSNRGHKKLYTFKYLSESCDGGSPGIISKEADKIKSFYTNKPGLKSRLFFQT